MVKVKQKDHLFTPASFAACFDHTLLNMQSQPTDIERVCVEALRYGFSTVCVRPKFIPQIAQTLRGAPVLPISVVGFPENADFEDWDTLSKVKETELTLKAGAQEIDMVLNKTALKTGDYKTVFSDIQAIVQLSYPKTVKVILETSLLTREEIICACSLAQAAGAGFVKTSTGFRAGGATEQDVSLMRQIVGHSMGVKASGGIKSLSSALILIQAGANRIGSSASVQILEEFSEGFLS